jgi:diguanylate cyclase (GGDEF)-like protein/PAS domain S-box-containing protein
MTDVHPTLFAPIRSLAFKTSLALGAAALPALAIAAILGFTLVTTVGEAETAFNDATSAARRLTDIRVLIEKEYGLVARLPAELDLARLDAHATDIKNVGQRVDTEIDSLAANETIVSPDVRREIRTIRGSMNKTTAGILAAARSFSQTTALALVVGPYETDTKVLLAFLDAITSNVDRIVEEARGRLRQSSLWAQRLVPLALVVALLAGAVGVWMIRRYLVAPVEGLTRHVLRIRESGNLNVHPDDSMARRADEIGTLAHSFNLMITELGDARRRLIEWSEAEIRTQFERLNAAINNMPQGLCMYDAEQKLIICNKRYAEIYGIDAAHTKPGTPLRAILEDHIAKGACPENVQEYVEQRLAAVAERKPFYHINEMRDGQVIAISYQPMANGGSLATHEDITERRRVEEKIAHMAHHDALTGLPNRVSFREKMEEALHHVARGESLAVLCLDLDHFKSVNDTLGHPVGDALLQAVAERIRASARPTDMVARLGGDEFAIVQALSDQPVGATALSQRLIKALSEPFEIHGHQVVIGVSVGIAVAPSDGDDSDRLLQNADMALYRAKEDGRGAFRFFETDMDTRMQHRRALELDLREAVALGGFELYYQPVVSLESRRIVGFEALLRWPHPNRGIVTPAEFIPLAEEIGLISSIGAWALKAACTEAMKWPGNLTVAVNLSPMQFKNGTVLLDVVAALGASGLSASRLELEITETTLLQDTDATIATLNHLRDLGVRISMDDFGTGYSSLGYLRKFPFDRIKIDRSFISDLSERADSVAIVRAVAGLSNTLGILTTAEGVETVQQLDRLKDEGCTEAQGYLFSAPRPARDLDQLLRELGPDAKAVA